MAVVYYIVFSIAVLAAVFFWLQRLWQGHWKKFAARIEEKLDLTQQNLANTHRDFLTALGDIYKNLGSLGQLSRDLIEATSSFEDIFRRPFSRGGLGEAILENLARDILPADKFQRQYTFRNGKKVDLAIFLPQGILCVDSKFTLDTFNNFVQSSAGEREALRKVFVRSVKARIDETASYIIPQEKSLDFALMYVPSEQVYYEIISDEGIIGYARQKKVFIVSPSSFYLYLKTIMVGFEGLRIEKEARRMLDYLKQVKIELGRVEAGFSVLGGHIKNTAAKYEETASALGKLKMKVEGVLKDDLQKS